MGGPADTPAGQCHCGTIRFLATRRRCACSLCRMRGAVAVSASLDGVGPFDFPDVPVLDGVNHPRDVGGGGVTVGTLRFEPTGPAG